MTLPGLSGVSAGGGAIQHECSRRAGARLGRGGLAVSAMATAANFCTGGIVCMGVPKPIVFRWITLINFKYIYFHQ